MSTLFEAAREVERLGRLVRELGPQASPARLRQYYRAMRRFDALCRQSAGVTATSARAAQIHRARTFVDEDGNTLTAIEADRLRAELTRERRYRQAGEWVQEHPVLTPLDKSYWLAVLPVLLGAREDVDAEDVSGA